MTRLFAFFLPLFPLLATAAGDAHGGDYGGAEAKHEVSSKAMPLFDHSPWGQWLTNSVFVAILVTVVFLWFFRSAMKPKALIPGKKQNFVELIVEFLYNQVE